MYIASQDSNIITMDTGHTIMNTRPDSGWFRGAIERIMTQRLVAAIGDRISQEQGIPQEKKEEALAALREVMGTGTIDTQAEAVQLNDMISDILEKFAQEMASGAANTASEGSKNGKGNWLVALARALSSIAGEHLKDMVVAADKIGALSFEGSDEENGLAAKQMTQLSAEMQASGQMFKMIQEATTTAIKTVGEALSSTARKQ